MQNAGQPQIWFRHLVALTDQSGCRKNLAHESIAETTLKAVNKPNKQDKYVTIIGL